MIQLKACKTGLKAAFAVVGYHLHKAWHRHPLIFNPFQRTCQPYPQLYITLTTVLLPSSAMNLTWVLGRLGGKEEEA